MYPFRSTPFFMLLLFLVLSFQLQAQVGEQVEIQFHLVDNAQRNLSNVSVHVSNDTTNSFNLTDENGYTSFQLPQGIYEIQFFHVSYISKKITLEVFTDQKIQIALESENNTLEEVIITAKEGKDLYTKSIINRKAMEHLQPSSFTDLMELVPGGLSKSPNLTNPNKVLIREFGTESSQYNTSSMGVQFVIDGQVLNSDVDMLKAAHSGQTVGKNGIQAAKRRENNNQGVDMRTIPTNDIESVEIIRGIPSASYGDLTSGLILIHRKSGQTNWQGRIKTDGFSKSYYLGKGFSINPTWSLNTSVDYLNAQSDPRDLYENYHRVATSLRSKKTYNHGNNSLIWNSNLDYTINLDNTKVDPDSGYDKTDYFKNNRQKISLSNNVEYRFTDHPLFKNIKLTANIRQGIENIDQRIFVQHNGPTSVSISQEEGINDGYFPEISFISHTRTEGRPIDINTKLETHLQFNTLGIKHNIETGLDFKYGHNYGRGEMFDPLKPPTPNSSLRPRSYKDIPANQNLAFFLGDRLYTKLNNHDLTLYGGARVSKMLGLESSYALSKKIFVEPRLLFQWGLPELAIGKHPLKTEITMGYGELYKQPTTIMLYPDKRYRDFIQLSYYHENPELRYVNYMTYVDDVTNKELLAAKNIKKEIRFDFTYAQHEWFITYFDENMANGFRNENYYLSHHYKRYDASNIIDPTEKPTIDNLPYEERTELLSRSQHANGSSTRKKGIEFGYYSPRYAFLNTKFTLTGAWFKVDYTNTIPSHEKPNRSQDGNSIPYVGIYKNDVGYLNSGMNYNFIVDTYLPSLDMNISASFQGVLFKDEDRADREAAPTHYYGVDGIEHPFLDSDRQDPYKRWLVRDVSASDNMSKHYTFDLRMNLKVTKRIYNSIRASLFVNKLVSHYSPYTFNGVKVNRKDVSEPYFGMELTYNF